MIRIKFPNGILPESFHKGQIGNQLKSEISGKVQYHNEEGVAGHIDLNTHPAEFWAKHPKLFSSFVSGNPPSSVSCIAAPVVAELPKGSWTLSTSSTQEKNLIQIWSQEAGVHRVTLACSGKNCLELFFDTWNSLVRGEMTEQGRVLMPVL